MNEQVSPSEYLVISRGQWDKDIAREEIQNAIDQFYVWLDRFVAEGKMKTGQRLANEGKTVSRKKVVTDGPFGEAKEVIGGYSTGSSWPAASRKLRGLPQETRVSTAACFTRSGPSTRSGPRPSR